MLSQLYIKNYILIDEMVTHFSEGLNVITGETGAGKSIVIGALGLLLGDMAKSDIVRKGTPKAIVEGTFQIQEDSATTAYLVREDLHVDKELIIRREVARQGRSRAFINDTPVTLQQLRNLGELLADLHGQHDHQSLLHTKTYPAIIDEFGGHNPQSETVASLFHRFQEMKHQLDGLKSKDQELQERKDYYAFQLKEIAAADLRIDEEEELEREITLMENHEKVWEITQRSYLQLYESDDAIVDKLHAIVKDLSEIESLDTQLKESYAALQGLTEVIADTAKNLASFRDMDTFDPSVLEQLRSRAAEIARLKRKYHKSVTEILELQEFLQSELEHSQSLEADISALEKRLEDAQQALSTACLQLSHKRKTAACKMSRQVTQGMKNLGIPAAQYQVQLAQVEDADGLVSDGSKQLKTDSTGVDQIDFLVSTNPGEDLKPLSRIASGGEISRTMLAIKSVLAGKHHVPILVFDEIDNGISGRIATIVGQQLRELGKHKQVIAITHLPQIAGYGDTHNVVYKEEEEERAVTRITQLDYEGRKVEIAKLIGGEKISPSSLKSAAELLITQDRSK